MFLHFAERKKRAVIVGGGSKDTRSHTTSHTRSHAGYVVEWSTNVNTQVSVSANDVFPLLSRPWGGALYPTPRNIIKVLSAEYGADLDVCVASTVVEDKRGRESVGPSQLLLPIGTAREAVRCSMLSPYHVSVDVACSQACFTCTHACTHITQYNNQHNHFEDQNN